MKKTTIPRWNNYICHGDTVSWMKDGFKFKAKIIYDDDHETPEDQDGFWPTLDPTSCGYIGPKTERTLARHMAHAREVLRAWKAEEWWYVGIEVTCSFDGIKLGSGSLWGIECNYPAFRKRDNPNAYLDEVTRECAAEALSGALQKLEKLAEKARET